MVAHLPLTNLFYLITFYLHDTTIVSAEVSIKTVCYALGKCAYSGITVI